MSVDCVNVHLGLGKAVVIVVIGLQNGIEKGMMLDFRVGVIKLEEKRNMNRLHRRETNEHHVEFWVKDRM